MEKVLAQAAQEIATVVLGKERQIQLSLCCLLADGHLLLEDLPGMGKTTLSHALAQVLGLQYRRVQFTSDLLPADILGASIFDRDSNAFQFLPGPIFTQVLLADEINRSTPKTQSALLEAMEERQVTIEGKTRPLPQPFFVIATQNPLEQLGTWPLPESQLDRFLMRISLGYPERAAERLLLAGNGRRQLALKLPALLTARQLALLQQTAAAIHVAEPLLDYVQDLVAATRSGQWFDQGLSPRAGIALLRAARAHALIAGRNYVAPDDVRAVLVPCAAHRLAPVSTAARSAEAQVHAMMDATALP